MKKNDFPQNMTTKDNSESKEKLEKDKSKIHIKLAKKTIKDGNTKLINIEKEKINNKVPRLKLNENLLFYNNIGVRKLYELTENLNFSEKMNEFILMLKIGSKTE